MRLHSLGWGLWVFLALAIAIPFWMFWPGNHPLAALGRFDLCPRIRAAADALATRPNGFAGPTAQEEKGSTGFCRLSFPRESDSAGERPLPELLVILTSQRVFGGGDPRARTDRFMEVNFNEMKASGQAPEYVKGPWRSGIVVTGRGTKSVDIWIEDQGVLLWVTSKNLPRDSVVEFTADVARALRKRN